MMRLYETTEFMRMTWETNRFANIQVASFEDISYCTKFAYGAYHKTARAGVFEKTLNLLTSLLKSALPIMGKTTPHK